MVTDTQAGQEMPYQEELAGECVVDGYAVGMPQLCFDWWGNQIFWLAITLIVIFFVLSRIALPRIAAVLAERQGTITNDLAAAEDLKAKAVAAEEAYQKALVTARAEAQKIIDATKEEIKADLNDAIAKADAEISARAAEGEKTIAAIRSSALENVKVVAEDASKEIVAVMGGKADGKAISSAVANRMKG
jgi:F-type H+-transporting ATPase subunit b